MLEFKKIELEDIKILEKYLKNETELSCENTFTNLLIWQSAYNNMASVADGMLFIKSGYGEEEMFSLPLGGDLEKGIELLKEHCGNKNPVFWTQDGERFERFMQMYGSDYKITEIPENFDYIYKTEDLAELSGKKYHSKRNHISAFSKKYDWHYETLSDSNISDIKLCAEEWYTENAFKEDYEMHYEKQGVSTILDNTELLGIKGGAIYVGDRVVAFTLGTEINSKIFNTHIEKALSDYDGAYAVINREFAKNELTSYELINREDDLGIEGLRKAKLSYKPNIILKKYICRSEE